MRVCLLDVSFVRACVTTGRREVAGVRFACCSCLVLVYGMLWGRPVNRKRPTIRKATCILFWHCHVRHCAVRQAYREAPHAL